MADVITDAELTLQREESPFRFVVLVPLWLCSSGAGDDKMPLDLSRRISGPYHILMTELGGPAGGAQRRSSGL